jgi:hypothetical protein
MISTLADEAEPEFQDIAEQATGSGETSFTFDGQELQFEAEGSLEKFQFHGNASVVRQVNQLSGAEYQLMHIFPQSMGQGIPGYNLRYALTRIAQTDIHASIDAGWLTESRALAASGQTQQSAIDAYLSVSRSIQASQMLTNAEKFSLQSRLADEMFMEFGLTPASPVRVPFSKP